MPIAPKLLPATSLAFASNGLLGEHDSKQFAMPVAADSVVKLWLQHSDILQHSLSHIAIIADTASEHGSAMRTSSSSSIADMCYVALGATAGRALRLPVPQGCPPFAESPPEPVGYMPRCRRCKIHAYRARHGHDGNPTNYQNQLEIWWLEFDVNFTSL
jgi:hypothetical protein